MRSQASQLSFGRTWRMTLKQARMYSSISATSSPSSRSLPPQSGQPHGRAGACGLRAEDARARGGGRASLMRDALREEPPAPPRWRWRPVDLQAGTQAVRSGGGPFRSSLRRASAGASPPAVPGARSRSPARKASRCNSHGDAINRSAFTASGSRLSRSGKRGDNMSGVCHKPSSIKEEKYHEHWRQRSNTHDRLRGPDGRSPVDPFQQHRQLGAAERDRSTVACGHTKRPRSSLLANRHKPSS